MTKSPKATVKSAQPREISWGLSPGRPTLQTLLRWLTIKIWARHQCIWRDADRKTFWIQQNILTPRHSLNIKIHVNTFLFQVSLFYQIKMNIIALSGCKVDDFDFSSGPGGEAIEIWQLGTKLPQFLERSLYFPLLLPQAAAVLFQASAHNSKIKPTLDTRQVASADVSAQEYVIIHPLCGPASIHLTVNAAPVLVWYAYAGQVQASRGP